MVYRGRANNEPRYIGRDLLPAVVFNYLSLFALRCGLGIVRSNFLRKKQVGMGNTSGPNFERFAHELVLSVDFAIVVPERRFSPACGDGWVVADLLRHIFILLVKANVFEGFALQRSSA